MVEPGSGMRLAQDPLGLRAGDLLDRHVALEAFVERPVYGAHPPRADPLEDPEALHHQFAHHPTSVRRPGTPSCLRATLRAPKGPAAEVAQMQG